MLMPGASDAFRDGHRTGSHGWRAIVGAARPPHRRAGHCGRRGESASPCGGRAGNRDGEFLGELTLPQLVDLMSRSDIGVTDDPGGIHLLGALHRPGMAVSNVFPSATFTLSAGDAGEPQLVYPPAFSHAASLAVATRSQVRRRATRPLPTSPRRAWSSRRKCFSNIYLEDPFGEYRRSLKRARRSAGFLAVAAC